MVNHSIKKLTFLDKTNLLEWLRITDKKVDCLEVDDVKVRGHLGVGTEGLATRVSQVDG